jgi:hypothetical protein
MKTTFTGPLTVGKGKIKGELRLGDADNTHYVGFASPTTVTTSLVWKLPSTDGSANQVLKTDGAGNLGWATDASNSPGGTTGQVQYNNAGSFGGVPEGSAGFVLTSNGAGVAPSFQAHGPHDNWATVQTADFTADADRGYPVNTTGGAIVVTLPASASLGHEVSIIDYAGTAATNNITINRNGHKIQGAASNMTVSTNRAAFTLVYIDATQGWLLRDV